MPPRSLFDRAAPGLLKMRREGKEQKKNLLLKQQTQFAKPLPTFAKPAAETGPDNPEWLISEDWALLQVIPDLGPSHVSVHALPMPCPTPCPRVCPCPAHASICTLPMPCPRARPCHAHAGEAPRVRPRPAHVGKAGSGKTPPCADQRHTWSSRP